MNGRLRLVQAHICPAAVDEKPACRAAVDGARAALSGWGSAWVSVHPCVAARVVSSCLCGLLYNGYGGSC